MRVGSASSWRAWSSRGSARVSNLSCCCSSPDSAASGAAWVSVCSSPSRWLYCCRSPRSSLRNSWRASRSWAVVCASCESSFSRSRSRLDWGSCWACWVASFRAFMRCCRSARLRCTCRPSSAKAGTLGAGCFSAELACCRSSARFCRGSIPSCCTLSGNCCHCCCSWGGSSASCAAWSAAAFSSCASCFPAARLWASCCATSANCCCTWATC